MSLFVVVITHGQQGYKDNGGVSIFKLKNSLIYGLPNGNSSEVPLNNFPTAMSPIEKYIKNIQGQRRTRKANVSNNTSRKIQRTSSRLPMF